MNKLQELYDQTSTLIQTNTFDDIVTKIGVLLVAFLAPIQPILLAILFLVFIDAVVGIWASVKEGKELTASKLSGSVTKIFVYIITIFVAKVTQDYLFFDVEFLQISKFAAGFIGITELKSIFENLNRISGSNLFSVLLERLSATQGAQEVRSAKNKRDKKEE